MGPAKGSGAAMMVRGPRGVAAALGLIAMVAVLASAHGWPMKAMLAAGCVFAVWLLWLSLPGQAEARAAPDGGEEFGALFESAPAAMVMLEPNGMMQRANQAFSKWLGYNGRELLRRNWWNLLDSEDLRESMAATGRLLDGKEDLVQWDARFRSRTGALVWAHVRLARFGDLVLAQIVDTSRRMESEQNVRRLNRELEQRVNELTALHQEVASFTNSITHDLRAPLRQVQAFSRILMEEHAAGMGGPGWQALERVSQAARQMNRMLDDLAEFARLGRHPMTTVACDLAALARQVIGGLESDCAGRTVEWRVGALPFADCDPVMAHQLLENLLANAVKFTRRQETAVIEVGSEERTEGTVFHVRDNGVGFPARASDRLFGLFQRLHRQEDFEGTGVGLASVRRIVERHGGRIWAESELGCGAAFYFTLSGPMRKENLDEAAQ
ncbi:MAG: PAS domain S-box protein [Acidimicrobiia bacterium]|nr:PAS domain S-box protein [Acidimicrobiia bacterium]